MERGAQRRSCSTWRPSWKATVRADPHPGHIEALAGRVEGPHGRPPVRRGHRPEGGADITTVKRTVKGETRVYDEPCPRLPARLRPAANHDTLGCRGGIDVCRPGDARECGKHAGIRNRRLQHHVSTAGRESTRQYGGLPSDRTLRRGPGRLLVHLRLRIQVPPER